MYEIIVMVRRMMVMNDWKRALGRFGHTGAVMGDFVLM